MADMDIFAAMGISGFGKAAKKRDLNPSRFDVAKRQDVPVSSHTKLVHLYLVLTICLSSTGKTGSSSRAEQDCPRPSRGRGRPASASFLHKAIRAF